MTSYPIQPNPPSELWLYSDGVNPAWCASKRDYLRMFPSPRNFAYRGAHDGEGIPDGWQATRNTGLADDSIKRKPTMKSFIKALSPR